jgi:chromate reductase
MSRLKISLIVGSFRRGSLNHKLAQALAKLGEARFEFTWVRIDDLPLFTQDLEQDPPPQAARFKNEVKSADGVLFVTPEHNRSLPAALKNAIDWGSRPYGQSVWAGKPAAIAGTSPGALGTASAQQHLRHILAVLDVVVLGQPETYVVFRPELIDDAGNVNDEATQVHLQRLLDRFAALAARFR